MSVKRFFAGVLLLLSVQAIEAQFSFQAGRPIGIACDSTEQEVVTTALQLLARDRDAVFGALVQQSQEADIIVGTVGTSSLLLAWEAEIGLLEGKKQAFLLEVLPSHKLLVAGSDAHGTAYGVMELSRLIGVSPWEWWADVTPERKTMIQLPAGFQKVQSPSVEYRGIFINDEDWGLVQWARHTYEPERDDGALGIIGPRTNERIFELLLRLRVNTYWPAMHECTNPFSLRKGIGKWPPDSAFTSAARTVNQWHAARLWNGANVALATTTMLTTRPTFTASGKIG